MPQPYKVQSNTTEGAATAGTVACNFTGVQTVGNYNLVFIFWEDATRTISSVTDTKLNSYSVIGGPIKKTTANALTVAIYFCPITVGATAGANTVTVTFSNSSTIKPCCIIAEYTNVSNASTFDGTPQSGTGTGTNAGISNITTSNPNDHLIAFVGHWATASNSSGWDLTVKSTNNLVSIAEFDVTKTGAYAASGQSLSASVAWGALTVALAGTPSAAPLVQYNIKSNTTATSATVNIAGAQTAGNLNLLSIGWSDATATVNTVTDSSGNLYTLIGTLAANTMTNAFYYCSGIKAALAGANTITVTFSGGSATSPVLVHIEYHGYGILHFTNAASNAGSTSPNSGTITTTDPNCLIVGMGGTFDAYLNGPTTGSILEFADGGLGTMLEDRVVTSTGTYSSSVTIPFSAKWLQRVMGFRLTPTATLGTGSSTSATDRVLRSTSDAIATGATLPTNAPRVLHQPTTPINSGSSMVAAPVAVHSAQDFIATKTSMVATQQWRRLLTAVIATATSQTDTNTVQKNASAAIATRTAQTDTGTVSRNASDAIATRAAPSSSPIVIRNATDAIALAKTIVATLSANWNGMATIATKTAQADSPIVIHSATDSVLIGSSMLAISQAIHSALSTIATRTTSTALPQWLQSLVATIATRTSAAEDPVVIHSATDSIGTHVAMSNVGMVERFDTVSILSGTSASLTGMLRAISTALLTPASSMTDVALVTQASISVAIHAGVTMVATGYRMRQIAATIATAASLSESARVLHGASLAVQTGVFAIQQPHFLLRDTDAIQTGVFITNSPSALRRDSVAIASRTDMLALPTFTDRFCFIFTGTAMLAVPTVLRKGLGAIQTKTAAVASEFIERDASLLINPHVSISAGTHQIMALFSQINTGASVGAGGNALHRASLSILMQCQMADAAMLLQTSSVGINTGLAFLATGGAAHNGIAAIMLSSSMTGAPLKVRLLSSAIAAGISMGASSRTMNRATANLALGSRLTGSDMMLRGLAVNIATRTTMLASERLARGLAVAISTGVTMTDVARVIHRATASLNPGITSTELARAIHSAVTGIATRASTAGAAQTGGAFDNIQTKIVILAKAMVVKPISSSIATGTATTATGRRLIRQAIAIAIQSAMSDTAQVIHSGKVGVSTGTHETAAAVNTTAPAASLQPHTQIGAAPTSRKSAQDFIMAGTSMSATPKWRQALQVAVQKGISLGAAAQAIHSGKATLNPHIRVGAGGSFILEGMAAIQAGSQVKADGGLAPPNAATIGTRTTMFADGTVQFFGGVKAMIMPLRRSRTPVALRSGKLSPT